MAKLKILAIAIFGLLAFIFIAFLLNEALKPVSSVEVFKETGRLNEINSDHNLTSGDLAFLGQLVSHNEGASEEFGELKFFALHNESIHVSHSLQNVYRAFAGEEFDCPLDELSHASVYLRYGEMELVEGSVLEAKEIWGTWLEKVTGVKDRFPNTYPDLETLRQKATAVFEAVDLSFVEPELNYIERNGFC